MSTTRVTWVSSDNVNIAAKHQEPAEALSQLGNTIFIGNRCKHKTTDIWRCANEDQCVPGKTGCSCCRTTTRGVRLARQGCWCCACRSSSPMLHESYCQIPSMSLHGQSCQVLSRMLKSKSVVGQRTTSEDLKPGDGIHRWAGGRSCTCMYKHARLYRLSLGMDN